MASDLDFDDRTLTPVQKRAVAALTETQLQEIDETLFAATRNRWRKTAMIVGLAMMQISTRFDDVPDVFFADRLRGLVDNGLLENQGDMRRMRYSEVRRVRMSVV